MDSETIRSLILEGLPSAEVQVSGDGRHFEAIVVSQEFEGKTLIQRHKMVLATVEEEIQSDRLHALSIKAYTPDQQAST